MSTAAITERDHMPRPYDPDFRSLLRRAATQLRADGHRVHAEEIESAADDLDDPPPATDAALEKQIEMALHSGLTKSAIGALVKAYQDKAPFFSSVEIRTAERALARQIILAANWRQ